MSIWRYRKNCSPTPGYTGDGRNKSGNPGRFREFFETVGVDTSVAEDFNLEYQLTLGDHIEFVENAKETLLSQKGKFIIAAVTNGTKVAQQKKLRLSGLDNIFDYVFISEDIGAEKPSAEFFDHVFEKMNISLYLLM